MQNDKDMGNSKHEHGTSSVDNLPFTEVQTIAREATAALEHSIDELDSATSQSLARIRHQALQQSTSRTVQKIRPRWQRNTYWGLGLAAAATVVLSVSLMIQPGRMADSSGFDQELADNLDPISQMLILADLQDDDMEIVDDLEFVTWLSQNQPSMKDVQTES